mmetsp:Transcript_8039/g.19795  ORF Transcript_8039/g.19795 Transcript_8039/m.19795 type:complete len:208 (-) Transcript_8039:684-1307(-)
MHQAHNFNSSRVNSCVVCSIHVKQGWAYLSLPLSFFQMSKSSTHFPNLLPRDSQSILTIDERSCRIHSILNHLVQHPLRAHTRFDSTLNVPNVFILLCHFCPGKSRMQEHHRVPHILHFLRKQHLGHVASSSAHVMSIISTRVLILSGAPFDTSGLGGDGNQLGTIGQGFRVDKGVIHAQWAKCTDIDLFQLLFKVQRIFFHKLWMQ